MPVLIDGFALIEVPVEIRGIKVEGFSFQKNAAISRKLVSFATGECEYSSLSVGIEIVDLVDLGETFATR